MAQTKKLHRSFKDKIIFGVCGGLGEYFDIDPLLFRLLFIILAMTGGSGIFIYIILAILMPKENEESLNKENLSKETRKRIKGLAEEMKEQGPWIKDLRNIIGLVIILIGLNLLAKQVFGFDFFAWLEWGIVFALLVIFIGIAIIKK